MTNTERWLPVVDWEGFYEVSDRGQVRSLDRRVPHRRGMMQLRGRPLVLGLSTSGYPDVILSRDGKAVTFAVHTLVLCAFAGPRPPDQEACHGPAGKLINHWPENLRWDTRGENNLDQVRDGTHAEARKTCCRRKHLLIAPNLTPSGLLLGRRDCLACSRGRAHIRRSKRYGHPVLELQVISDKYYAEIMGAAAA